MRQQLGPILGGKLSCPCQKCHGRSLEFALPERRRFSRNRHGVVWGRPPVPNTFFMNPSGFSFLASRSLSVAKAGQPLPMRSNVSLTVFFALCVLGADFMIYFFFKLLYHERHRTRPRRLPREYYRKEEKTSPLYRSPARKSHSDPAGDAIPANRSTANYFDIDACAPTPVGVARVGNGGGDIWEGRG